MAARQTQAAPVASFVNFKPSNFSEGGVLQEGDYFVKSCRVQHWDYDGKAQGASTIAAKFILNPFVGGKVDESKEYLQYYSCGDPSAFSANEDGTKMVATSTRSQISKSSNYFTFVENVVNSGFPEDKIEDDFSVWDGMIAHFTQIAQQTRAGLPQSNLVQGQQQNTQPRTLPVITSIIKLPWANMKTTTVPARAAAVPAAAPKVNGAPAPAAAASGDLTELLQEHIAAVLKSEGTPLARTKLRVGVFKSMNASGVDTAIRDSAMKIFGDDATLENVLMGVGNGHLLNGADVIAT